MKTEVIYLPALVTVNEFNQDGMEYSKGNYDKAIELYKQLRLRGWTVDFAVAVPFPDGHSEICILLSLMRGEP